MAGPQFVYVMKGLSKTYPGGKQVLKDIWLRFYPGAKIGIVGVNDAGKSTLMKIIAGMKQDFIGEALAADAAAWRCASCGWTRPIYCCWTNQPTISTRNR